MSRYASEFIEGARQNGFGRPVNIQLGAGLSHLDTAKLAGQIRALAEAEFTLKEASEYLGVAPEVIETVVELTR